MDQDSNPTSSACDAELRPYEFFMLLLCAYSLLSLTAETFLRLQPETVAIMDSVDNLVCGIFLLDFIISFGKAANKLHFMRWGWIDLLSSIPGHRPIP